jgi:hypothetical protein
MWGYLEMNNLARYIELFVDPTFEDLKRNRNSARHTFLACVVIYHAVERVPDYHAVRDQWRKDSPDFLMVEMVAHHFKHVRSSMERKMEKCPPPNAIPLSFLVFGNNAGGEDELEMRNFFYHIQDAVRFLHKQVEV